MTNVCAHITGTVSKIEKRPGDAVRPGEAVILESMKMRVEASAAGKVKEVRCQGGQSVSEGDVLMVIE